MQSQDAVNEATQPSQQYDNHVDQYDELPRHLREQLFQGGGGDMISNNANDNDRSMQIINSSAISQHSALGGIDN